MNKTMCRISVCTSCKTKGTDRRPGHALIEELRAALGEDPALAASFEVAGVACMAGCKSPCTVGFHGVGKASYLFGDLEPGQDSDDIVKFARQYALLHDGWCSSVDRPGKLRKSTLARVPATLFAAPQNPEDAQ